MTGVAELYEPLTVCGTRHLLQHLDPPPVVLDQLIEGIEDRRDSGLNGARREVELEVFKERLPLEVRNARRLDLVGIEPAVRVRRLETAEDEIGQCVTRVDADELAEACTHRRLVEVGQDTICDLEGSADGLPFASSRDLKHDVTRP